MGLLDGDLQAVFGQAFGGLYMDGELYRPTRTETDGGDVTLAFAEPEDVKVQIDAATEAMRKFERYTARSVRLIVLQIGPEGDVIARPNTDAEVSVGGERWKLSDATSDPASTHWSCLANPA